jgi:hypothetical protein
MTRRARILVRTAWGLTAFAISGPAMEFVLNPIVRHLPSALGSIVAPFAVLDFLDYAFGRFACVALAVCVALVLLSGGINWRVKIVLTVSAAVTCYVTPRWVEKVRHLW